MARKPRTYASTATEDAIQKAFIAQAKMLFPPSVVYHSTPNERNTTVSNMAKMKAMGLTPGAADIVVMWPEGRAYIEFKSATGVQKPDQVAFENWCRDAGVPYLLCRSSKDAFDGLTGLGCPVRGVVG